MKKTIKLFMLALMIAPVILTGCKKGEGDPFLSLKSRKARLVGEWNVTAGKGSSTNSGITTTWTYDGAQNVTTYPSPLPTSTDKYTMKYTFEKDGTYELVYTDNNNSTPEISTAKGTWNFTGRVGELKNKSQLVLTTTSYTTSAGTVTVSGSEAMNEIMDIYQLKNKEIIIKWTGTDSDGDTEEGEWTWTAI